jgi:urate oxidase
MTTLGANRYGKVRVRLVKVKREASSPLAPDAPHDLIDLTIDVMLEGAFEAVYVDGDNGACLATDTMKNTVYAFARQDPLDEAERFALKLADHFVAQPAVSRAVVSSVEQRWDRLSAGGRPHPHAFARRGGEEWTTTVSRDAGGARVSSGLTNLVVLKTTDSAFAGFPRDAFTTLPETTDRILATAITATWQYRDAGADYRARERIRAALVEAFAAHDSRSVQHTLYAMGEAALASCGDITEISLSLPNRHHVLVDLRPFGLDNPNEIFVATDQPYGLIEATIRRE